MNKRFFFYGHSSAMSGRIYRPDPPFDIDVNCASALTPAGGICQSSVPGRTLSSGTDGCLIRFGRASTQARGSYNTEADARAMTETGGRNEVRLLPSTSHVSAEVSSFEILGVESGLDDEPRLKVGTVRAELTSYCYGADRPDRPEPDFSLGKSGVNAVYVDGWEFIVKVDTELFSKASSYRELEGHYNRVSDAHRRGRSAASARARPIRPHKDTDGSVSLLASQLDLEHWKSGAKASYHKDVPEFAMPFYGSIVKSIELKKKQSTRRTRPCPDIYGHTIIAKKFGKIFFGEIVIGEYWRRLTMMRLELGSPVGGEVALSSVSKNGSWVP